MSAIKNSEDALSPLYARRAAKLAFYADYIGKDSELASLLGISPARLHHIIRKKDAPFTEKLARSIEKRLGKPLGWLDVDEDIKGVINAYSVPVYFLEDIIETDNLNKKPQAKPAGYYNYIMDIANAYFIKITTNTYMPVFGAGDMILINPNETVLENSNIYILSYKLSGMNLRALIRKYENNNLIDCVTNEIDNIDEYTVHGKCKLAIKTNLMANTN